MDLIIFAHPDNLGSHNAAILKHVAGRLRMKFAEFEVIDLYADGFDPVFRTTREPESKAALVRKYQQKVAMADRLIFIHPVWWYNVPAMLKGFIEHVFHSGFAYDFKLSSDNSQILEQKLKGKTAIVINTYGRSKAEAKARGNPLAIVLDKCVLGFCGIKVAARIEWFDVKGPALLPKEIVNRIDAAL
ncbi:NAD(P)H-dependent oxidoreductase [Candidatus Micrarchaeota archaeon]|nr:NAD(P)H-dependent oxidoreductase [Candidatus Micrarchaeota archaeon]